MRAKHNNGFEDLYHELEDEAKAEGPDAIRDLRAKEFKYTLVNTLIARRRELKLTQQALAAASGVAQTEISRIERGRQSPTLDTFSRLASALRLELIARANRPRKAAQRRAAHAGYADRKS